MLHFKKQLTSLVEENVYEVLQQLVLLEQVPSFISLFFVT